MSERPSAKSQEFPTGGEAPFSAILGRRILEEVGRVVVGQRELLEGLLIGLMADGHVLVEGAPGLAKTLAVSETAKALGGTFRRIQFTPDLLPSDLLGSHVLDPSTGRWSLHPGPIFAQFVLADEINRAPPKVQSALLEAMQERQVTLWGETRPLPKPFLVLATENPIEHEGTYPLPEAELDRFLLKIVVGHPGREEEKEIARRMARTGGRPHVRRVAAPEDVLRAREEVDAVSLDPRILDYAVDLVMATRRPSDYGLADLDRAVRLGASPRATLGLVLAAKARALLDGRVYVLPDDVKRVAFPVLRHRVLCTFEAEAEGVDAEAVVRRILETVAVP